MSPAKRPAASDPLERAVEELRAFALAYPETREDYPWGHSAFKVRDKIFLSLSCTDAGLRLSTKLPDSKVDALMLPFTEPTHYGMGKHGWVTASFAPGDEPPMVLLRNWVDESFRAIAPKRVVASLTGDEIERAVAAAAKKTSKKKAAKKKAAKKKAAKKKAAKKKAR